jgi:hypothetical protein
MSKLIIGILFISTCFAAYSPMALYGQDDRLDLFEVNDIQVKNQARALAAIILNKNLIFENDKILLQTQVYGKSQNLCLDEKFYNQPAIANCTGFLVGKDLILTAGHCFKILPCESFSFVFDYQMTSPGNIQLALNKNQVFQCQEILAIENEGSQDFALVRLKHKIEDRPILKLNTEKPISLMDSLYLLGFPSGLPLKADLNKNPRSINIEKGFFSTEFDAFGANSGSPVINHQTLQVQGVLVRGEYDFEWDNTTNCRRVKKCPPGTCKGEEAQILPRKIIDFINSQQDPSAR